MATTTPYIIGIVGAEDATVAAYMLRSILDGDEAYRHTGIVCALDVFDGFENSPGVCELSPSGLQRHSKHARSAGLEYLIIAVPCTEGCPEPHILIDLDRGTVACSASIPGRPRTMSFSQSDGMADVHASDVRHQTGVLSFGVHTPTWAWRSAIPIAGGFYLHSALAAIATSELLEIPQDRVVERLYHVRVPGRMELICAPDGMVAGLVDCAGARQNRQSVMEAIGSEFPGFNIIVCQDGEQREAVFRAVEQAYASRRSSLVCMFPSSDAACRSASDIFNDAVRALGPGVRST